LDKITAEYVDINGNEQVVTAVKIDDGSGKIEYTVYLPVGVNNVDLTAVTGEPLANVYIADSKDNTKYQINTYTWENYAVVNENNKTNVYVKATDSKTEAAYVLNIVKVDLTPDVTMFADGEDPLTEQGNIAKYNSSADKLSVRVTPGTPGQLEIEKTGYYVRYGHIKYTTDEEYAKKASLYSDTDADFEWYEWYDGTTMLNNALPTVHLVTGDNAVTLIKIQVGVKVDADSGIDIGGGRYLGTNKIYNLFVYQMYDAEDELEIVLDSKTTVNKDNSTPITEDGKTVYVYDYGVSKDDSTNTVDMVVKAITENNMNAPATSYTISGLVDSDGNAAADINGTINYNLVKGDYTSDNVDITINAYDADKYNSPTDVPVTHVDIVSASESGTKVYYRINIYRMSDDASLKTLIIPANAENNLGNVDITDNTVVTEIDGVKHYAVEVPRKYLVTDEEGNQSVPVYIESASDKAVITVTDVSGRYVHETVVDEYTKYINVPITLISSKAKVTFKITAEDGTIQTNHVIDIVSLSSDANVESILLATLNAQSMAEYVGVETIDGVETVIYKGFLSSNDVGKVRSSVTVSVAAKEVTSHITMDKKHTIVRNTGVNEVCNENTGTAEGMGTARYTYTKSIKKMQKDEYTYMDFTVLAEDGITQKNYRVRLYPMDDENTNLETKDYDGDTLVSLWVADVGTLDMMDKPNAQRMPEDEVLRLYGDTVPTYVAYVSSDLTTVEIKGRTEHDYAGIRIANASGYKVKEQIQTVSGLKVGQDASVNIYVRSQNLMNTVSGSKTGLGTQYRLVISRVPNNRNIDTAEIAPPALIDPNDTNEEHNNSFALVDNSKRTITAEINYGATIVPIELKTEVTTAIISIEGDVIGGTPVSEDEGADRVISGTDNGTLDFKVNFEGDEDKTFKVLVKNQDDDRDPWEYTLVLKRKVNNLLLESVYVDERITDYLGMENDIPVYSTEILYDAEIINIKAITADASAYVDVKKNNDTEAAYQFEQSTSNTDFNTDGIIKVEDVYEYTIYVGSSNLVGGVPDQIKKAILRIKRLKADQIPSDLSVVMRVSHLENDAGRLATPSTLGGSLADPASYEVLINQNAVNAYINVTNNYNTTILSAHPMDNDGNVDYSTTFGPDIQRLGFSVPMADEPYITVRVVAENGAGAVKEYNLNIRRESNDATLKSATTVDLVDYYGVVQSITVSAANNGVNNGINYYRLDLPEGSSYSKFRLEANSPYATIELYDEASGKYVSNNDAVKYIKNTISYPVGNVRTTNIKFRIVPASVSYSNDSTKTDQYSPTDGCTYYNLEVINTPQGTGLQDVFAEYVIETDGGTKASVDGHSGYIVGVPQYLTSTNLKIVPKSQEAHITVVGYEDQSSEAGTTIIQNFALDEGPVTEAKIIVESVSKIKNEYTLRILKLTNENYNMVVYVQRDIDAPWNEDEQLYIAERKLPTYQTEGIVTAMFVDHNLYDKGYKVLVGEESSTNQPQMITNTNPSVSNTNVRLSGAETYVPITIYSSDSVVLASYNVLIEKESVDNILESIFVERRPPDEDNTTAAGDRVFKSYVYNTTATASVLINAVDTQATVELMRLDNAAAQDQIWRSMSTGSLNAGVTELKEGDNEFMFIIRPANTQIYGAYYLTIHYSNVDVSLDMLEVQRDGDKDPLPFRDKEFKPNIFDYEVDIDSTTGDYIFRADAKTSLKDITDKGITDELKIYIGDYSSMLELEQKAEKVTLDGGPIERRFTAADLQLNSLGYTEIPVTVVLGDYTKEYVVIVHEKSGDADLSHTEVGLGVTGYQIEPVYDYNTDKYELTVDANVTEVEIYALANHIHKNSTTLLTLSRKTEFGTNIVNAALNNMRAAVTLSTGINEFIVTVESENSKNTRDYYLTINRNQAELIVDTLTVNGMIATRQGNDFFAYVAKDDLPDIVAQSTYPLYVTTSIVAENGVDILGQSDGYTAASAVDVVQTHGKDEDTTEYIIRLVDNDNPDHSQDYKLIILNPVNEDILSIILGTNEGEFKNSDVLGYEMPISAKWDETRNAYVAGVPVSMMEATIRVTTVYEGKLVKIGSFSAQNYDYYDTTKRQFTAKDKVVVPQTMQIGVTEFDTSVDAELLPFRYYTLIIEPMNNEANLYNADFLLATESSTDAPHTDFTVNLPGQLDHSYVVDNDIAYITFTGLKMSDRATGIYSVYSRNNSVGGIFNDGDNLKIDLNEGVNNIKIHVTSEDRMLSKTYSFNITRHFNENVSKLNDIKIQIGDKYYDTVAVPSADYTMNVLTYHLTIPEEIDETVTPIVITAVPFDDGLVYNITNRVIINGDTSDASTTSSKEVIIGAGSAKYDKQLEPGDKVRVVYNVKTDGKNASEYVIELFKDSNINLDPEMAYLTNIMRADTGTPLTRRFTHNQYDYNYYASVDETVHKISLSLAKNIGAQHCDVYILKTDVNSSGAFEETKTKVTNLSDVEMILQPGDNLMVFEVSESDENGNMQNARYYSVNINRAATAEVSDSVNHTASLADIDSENYALLTGMFDKDIFEYFLAIPYDEDRLSLILNTVDEQATMRVRKEGGEYLRYDLGNSANLSNIPLHYGSNKIVITVTAQDGMTKKTYIIDANRATPEHTGDIIHMDHTYSAEYAPLFNAKLTNYFMSYDYGVSEVSFTPTLRPEETSHPVLGDSHIYVSDSATNNAPIELTSGQTYTITNLPYGDTDVLFKVRTFNGTEKHYVVTVNRAYGIDRPYLEAPIEIYSSSTGAEGTKYTLSRDFYKSENAYYLNVSNDVNKIWIKAVTDTADGSRPNDSITINNTSVASGDLTAMNIYNGDNMVEVAVDNSLGTIERYTVVINRAENDVRSTLDSGLKLDDLVIDDYHMVPSFDSDYYDYIVIADRNTETIDMAPFFDEDLMSVTINNMPITSGEKLSDAEIGYMSDDRLGITRLKTGANYFDIVLTAKKDAKDSAGKDIVKDSQTKVHYVVNIVKPGETIAELDYLATDKGSMGPVFDPIVNNYFVTVPYDTDSFNIDTEALLTSVIPEHEGYVPFVRASSSTVNVVNNNDGTFTVRPPVGRDSKVIFLVYPSEKESYPASAYSLTINRRTSDTVKSIDLSDIRLTASNGAAIPLTTDFTARDVNYYAYVGSGVTSVDITAIPEYAGTTVRGDGSITLTGDVTTAIITTGDNEAKQRYSLTIIRRNSNAELTQLDVDGTSLGLNTGSQTYVNTAALTALPITVASANADDVIRINGKRITDGTLNPVISTDREKYDIRVTAADGSSYVHTLFVNADKAEDEYEPYITDIVVRDVGGAVGTFDKTVEGNVHTYNVMVDTKEIELFAYSLIDELDSTGQPTGSKTPNRNVTIEMFDEELNDYLVSTQFGGYIRASLDPQTGMGTYRFRATEYAESGFENISEYIVNVYNTENPILTDLEVAPYPDAIMADKFKGTNYGPYDVFIGKDVEDFDVIAKSFQSVDIKIGLVDEATGIPAYGAASNPNTTNILTPLDKDNFTVKVETSYDKQLPDGSVETRTAVYALNVIRSPYPSSNVYLADLDVVEEDTPDNGKYELNREFNEVIRVYNTTVDYVDSTVSMVIKKKQESDRVYAQLGTSNAYEMFTDTPQEFTLPTSFMTNDNARENIEFTVYDGETGDVGHYRVTVIRGERLDGILRLESLVLDNNVTPITPVFDPETWSYSAVIAAGQDNLIINAVAKEPADTVVITHNSVSTQNVDGVDTTFGLSETDSTEVFFITVSSAGAYSSEGSRTYVLRVDKQNTAFLTNLEVTDTDLTDNYYELNPIFNQGTAHYTVTVPVLAQEIEFTASADTDNGNITGTRIVANQDGQDIADQITDVLKVTARLDLSKTSYNFKFVITNDDGGYGIYRVNVLRDVPPDTPVELQTAIKGQVNTVAPGDNVVTVSLYKDADYSVTEDETTLVKRITTGADGKFLFDTSDITDTGVYSLTVRRAGYLTYYISNIDVQKSYAKAIYDFSRIDMITGDIVTVGDSHDVIDMEDIEYFKKLIAGEDVTMDEIYGKYAEFYQDALRPGTMQAVENEDKENQPETPSETTPDDGTPTEGTETTPDGGTPTEGTETTPDGGTPTEGTETTPNGETPTEGTETTPNGETPAEGTETTPDDGTPTEGTETTPDDGTPTEGTETTPNGETSTEGTETTPDEGTSADDTVSDDAPNEAEPSIDTEVVTLVLGVYDEISVEEEFVEITEVEEIVINSDDIVNTDNETNDTQSNDEAVIDVEEYIMILTTTDMVDSIICDFNRDGKINGKDKLYISTHMTLTAPNLDNRTGKNRVLVSAYN
ncbi:MAG: cadherin-like beta sandwich domain-containing protein, partial [Clostridia bacterium]|nr:cadherin-like beta sandwich domain-containing protein [Clostridia bacterium]